MGAGLSDRMAAGVASPNVALMGCGRWGRHILRDLVALGCGVAVVDPDEAARRHALDHGANDASATLAGIGPCDGIVIATPAGDHAGAIEAALDRSVAIFCEKPLALDAAQATRLAARGEGRLFVMDKWRYHPGIEALRDLARSGELGEVVGLRTSRIGAAPPQVDTDPIWTLATHDLSIALEILGDLPEPRMAVADFVDGKPAGLTALLGEKPWFVLEVGGFSAVERREVRVSGSAAVAVLADAYSDHVDVMTSPRSASDAPSRRTLAISTELPLLRELRTFVTHLSGGPAPRSSAAEGARIAATVARLRQMAGIDDVVGGGAQELRAR